jgi:hypothetical protein
MDCAWMTSTPSPATAPEPASTGPHAPRTSTTAPSATARTADSAWMA